MRDNQFGIPSVPNNWGSVQLMLYPWGGVSLIVYVFEKTVSFFFGRCLVLTSLGRLEGFFKVLPKSPEELAKQKRKAEEDAAAKKAAKKGKTTSGAGRGRPK